MVFVIYTNKYYLLITWRDSQLDGAYAAEVDIFSYFILSDPL